MSRTITPFVVADRLDCALCGRSLYVGNTESMVGHPSAQRSPVCKPCIEVIRIGAHSEAVEQRAEELAQQKVDAANASLVTSQATIDRYKAEQSALQTQVKALTDQVRTLKEHISEYRSWRELLHRVVRSDGSY